MAKLTLRSIKNSTPWDWAYICSKIKGECEKCSCFKNGRCAFTKKDDENFRNIMFETRIFFTDYQQEMLMNYFSLIIQEKEKQNEAKQKKEMEM